MRNNLLSGDTLKPLVVFLNGTSSAGKTSIAHALQVLYGTPLLHTGIDTLYTMLPQKALGETSLAKDGYWYVMKNGILDHVEIGPYARRLLACTVPLTQVLLEQKNDVVIDEILFAGEGRDFLYAYADIFVDARAYFVKVDCALEILEKREIDRGNRHKGLARLQYNHVHNHPYAYDIVVDSGAADAVTCAQSIMDAINNNPEPQAFNAIRSRKKVQ
jgi:chloramphenicol 3-O phosphotransferase